MVHRGVRNWNNSEFRTMSWLYSYTQHEPQGQPTVNHGMSRNRLIAVVWYYSFVIFATHPAWHCVSCTQIAIHPYTDAQTRHFRWARIYLRHVRVIEKQPLTHQTGVTISYGLACRSFQMYPRHFTSKHVEPHQQSTNTLIFDAQQTIHFLTSRRPLVFFEQGKRHDGRRSSCVLTGSLIPYLTTFVIRAPRCLHSHRLTANATQ